MFRLRWTEKADRQFRELQTQAGACFARRRTSGKKKSSKQEGLFKQVHKTITFLRADPRHPSLQTHEYDSLENPYDKRKKVFEAYAQQKTPGAYRVFWCYGPDKGDITIIAITPHS